MSRSRKPEVIVVRSNSITHDVRVQKIIRTLSKKYKVLVLGWNRENRFGDFEINAQGAQIKRLKLKAPYGHISLLLYMPVFWIWVIINLVLLKPKVIHACDLDTLIPCLIFKLFYRKVKVVFDSFERYAMAFILPTNIFSKLLFNLVFILENILAMKSDALIVTSEERLRTFGAFVPKYKIIVMNTPEDLLNEVLKIKDKKIKKRPEEFLIIYAGGVAKWRGILLLKKAIEDLENVRLVIAGRIIDVSLNELIEDPKIQYLGILSHKEALALMSQADVIPILYDPKFIISRYANPNKLYEAMMLGVPVLSNVCKNIIKKIGCGIIINYNANDIREALIFLKENINLRKQMGLKGRIAFKKEYEWNIMEKRIEKLYFQLLSR